LAEEKETDQLLTKLAEASVNLAAEAVTSNADES